MNALYRGEVYIMKKRHAIEHTNLSITIRPEDIPIFNPTCTSGGCGRQLLRLHIVMQNLLDHILGAAISVRDA